MRPEAFRIMSVFSIKGKTLSSEPGEPQTVIGFQPEIFTAATALSSRRVVYIDGDGLARYADVYNEESAYSIAGMTGSSVGAGGEVSVYGIGPIEEGAWNWNMQQSLFLWTAGRLTQSPPQDAAFMLGFAWVMSPTKIFIRIEEPIFM